MSNLYQQKRSKYYNSDNEIRYINEATNEVDQFPIKHPWEITKL